MNQIDQYREQLSALKDRSPEFYKNIEVVEGSNQQRWFDRGFIQAMETVIPYMESLPKPECTNRCVIEAKQLDEIKNIILTEKTHNG